MTSSVSNSKKNVFGKNWFFGGVDQLSLSAAGLSITQWGRTRTFLWTEIISAELNEKILLMKGSVPLRRKTLVLKTAKKKYRLRISNKYSSEIKNPEQFIEELQRYVSITRTSNPDYSQQKIMLIWVLSLFVFYAIATMLSKGYLKFR